MLPTEGFVRLEQILSVIPVGRSTWFAGVKKGRFPKPTNVLGVKCSLWSVDDIRELIDVMKEGIEE